MIDKTFLNNIIANPYKISKLEFRSILQILRQAEDILKKETLLLELSVDDFDSEIFVIGDIHGNMKSLLKLIEIIEQANPKYVIFLGDIVDRGPYQLECLILILSLKITQANKYFFLKGNHESLEMNEYYGFYQDFINRFKDLKKFYDVLALYKVLPFCALVNRTILCLHGGIPEDNEILRKLKGIKTQDLALDSKNTAKSLWQIMWNDPKSNLNGFSESFRGKDIKFFGEDVFNDFMKKNKLKYLIRSHELYPEGYRWFFKKRLLSIFSSANYGTNFAPNPASYAIIKNNLVIPKLVE
ncbi:MAG: metallophosphoesterase [Candidatus Lokiarchaeota archaeon]|nr:metallophosphoesterase [Candidatus Lokiarchaeota archaeon]